MVRLFVRHRVSDFPGWKSHYDSFEGTRQRLGVRGEAVFCGAEAAEDVTIWHDFDDLAAAHAFMAAPELAAAMAGAGVAGEPEVWFCRRELP